MYAPITLFCIIVTLSAQTPPDPAATDAEVAKIMSRTNANGLAIAVIDRGRPAYTRAYGIRNAAGGKLTTDTIMYGASLTKTLFA